MDDNSDVHVSVLGAGSAYGIYLVKWAYQLMRRPEKTPEGLSLPRIRSISYSNTSERNTNLVLEVLQDDLHQMAGFEDVSINDLKKDVRGYVRWREMIKAERPGLVVVCSPTETHVSVVRELITDFGVKGILCENPLTPINDSDSLPGLEALVREKGVIFGVNQQYSALGELLADVPLHPEKDDPTTLRNLMEGVTSAEVTFITHGTRPWRRFGNIGELIILEDLCAHALYFLPPSLRRGPVSVRKVTREGDNIFLNLVEYDLLFGKIPVRLVLGYRRKLKSLKVTYNRGKESYEFHVTGATNPKTGEYTRAIEGKNYAYPFRYALPTDLVKHSFMRSLAGRPLVPLEEAIRGQNTIRDIYQGSSKLK